MPASLQAKSTKPVTLTPACPRYPVKHLAPILSKAEHLNDAAARAMDHNQQIASCCRQREEHDIEAFKSHPDQNAPDIYIYHCKCGRKHRIFCVGRDDVRPFWNVR